jgi:hypothetical protein
MPLCANVEKAKGLGPEQALLRTSISLFASKKDELPVSSYPLEYANYKICANPPKSHLATKRQVSDCPRLAAQGTSDVRFDGDVMAADVDEVSYNCRNAQVKLSRDNDVAAHRSIAVLV